MKKVLFVIVVAVLLLSACDAVKVQEESVVEPPNAQSEARDPVIESLATQQAELSRAVLGLATQVANLAQNEGKAESQPVSANEPVSSSVKLETTQGKWEVSFFEGATDQMREWFSKLQYPAPALWPRFPNVDNPAVGFKSADGLEYGLDESVFMEQNEFGQMPVQARGYRLISGDYNIPGIDACEAADVDGGCAIAIFNVGDITADLKAWVRQGFTVPGRYWNGDTLEVAMWALSSHVSANMLNMETYGAGSDTLNQPDRTNAGANCSVVDGCQNVRFVIAVTSGNQLLVKAVTVVSK